MSHDNLVKKNSYAEKVKLVYVPQQQQQQH